MTIRAIRQCAHCGRAFCCSVPRIYCTSICDDAAIYAEIGRVASNHGDVVRSISLSRAVDSRDRGNRDDARVKCRCGALGYPGGYCFGCGRRMFSRSVTTAGAAEGARDLQEDRS